MSKFLKKLKRRTKNEYCFIADEEDNVYSTIGSTSSGCHILNALLSGDLDVGIVDGKRYLFAGDPATGKSYITAFIVKKYLDEHPTSIAVCIETEGSSILEMCDAIGIDKSRVLVVPIKTVEEMRTQVSSYLSDLKDENEGKEEDQKQKMIFWVDSIGNLSTKKEVEDVESGAEAKDMTRAQLLKGFGRSCGLELSLQKVPMVMVTHLYATMDMYSPPEIGGGSGVKYISDAIIVFTKAKDKEGTKQVGVVLTGTTRKSRFVQENLKGKIVLSFKNGLYPYSGLAELGQSLGVFVKEGNSYVMPDGTKASMKKVRTKFKEFATEINMLALKEAIQKEWGFGE